MIAGVTVKVAVALSTTGPLDGQVTVIVYRPAAAAAGAAPTVNEPTTNPVLPLTEALYEATTLPDGELSVTLQVVPTAEAPAPVVLIMITSPCFPVTGLGLMRRAAFARGSAIEAIETNSAEVSSTTKNRELELRVVNLTHATMMSRCGHIKAYISRRNRS